MIKNLTFTNNIYMKIKKFLITILLIFTAFLPVKVRALSNQKERKIIFQTEINLLGDEQVETIILSGVEKQESPFYEDIKITVFEQRSGKLLYSLSPNVNYGYEPKLSLVDFDLDGVFEVFYSAESGAVNKGGYFYVYTFNNDIVTLYDFEVDVNLFTAKYQNYYKVAVKGGEKEFLIDISSRGDKYLSKLYTKNAKLQKQTLASVSGVNMVIPYYNYLKNEYIIKVVRKVSGENISDVICKAVTDLEFVDNKFKVKTTYVEI